MGFLRYFLAIVVLYGHMLPRAAIMPMDGNGGMAVQAFFVISGFYMSLISDKYHFENLTYENLKNFYITRFLRIYPLYILCLVIFISLSFAGITSYEHAPAQAIAELANWGDKALYLFSTAFMFGQGLMRFLVLDPTTHAFYLNPLTDSVNPHLLGSGFAILGQAWTLSLELTFYVLAPFLLTRSVKFISIICALSFTLRYQIHLAGLSSYNISTAFFPTALGIFLLGSLAHKLIYPSVKKLPQNKLRAISSLILAVVLWFSFKYYFVPNGYEHKHWGFIIFVAGAIPFLFETFKNSKVDNFIGELSYPVYLIHLMCISIVYTFITPGSPHADLYAVAITTMLAAALTVVVVKPIDNFRHRIINGNLKTTFYRER
jgi:peptidoglycan/LPS O-acetylase OafA/YrhL